MMNLYAREHVSRLLELAEKSAVDYRNAQPFPHIVIDDFLPAEVLDEVLREYPEPSELDWIRFDKAKEKKLAFNEIADMPPVIREVLGFLNSAPTLRFLERLTGIQGLLSDPYYVGGGLHMIRGGGHLGVHVDFNKREGLDLDRRLNLLVYLNRDWREEWGGQLELWDAGMQHAVKRVAPLFNRCVVFSTTEESYHGHPDPLRCPADRARRSLATYYYTRGRPDAAAEATSHSTIFRNRRGIDDRWTRRAARALTAVGRELSPPVLTRALRRLRRR